MSLLVRSAAHFLVISDDINYGRIVTSDGDYGADFVSKHCGRNCLQHLIKEGRIATDEAKEVANQIDNSSLPEHDIMLERLFDLSWRIEDIEDIVLNDPEVGEDGQEDTGDANMRAAPQILH